ncbi:HNH endonuclease [Tenacibaculum aiptasiae]|uniref:HNH endonuclease n=1 Tax=Tenacibaculum aiptasiae TaxID=426481 RepID=A0A7J5ALT7_9FLAO|nr:HNH endonuclease signature motif containing protein [Tenacibaculum aiptasiae]KAB1158562.1 HNH endonuclease [Tenacibaculum aiptasiae]
MPDINAPVVFNSEQTKLIRSKLEDDKFTHKDWADESLLDLRSHIRNHYRDLDGKCSYCKSDVSIQSANNANVEHIVPKSKVRNFIFEPKNLCTICVDCNTIKREQEVGNTEINPIKRKEEYKHYPRSSNAFIIVHPHFDNYEEHIFKCGDFYIDLSSKGSQTMLVCKLNRKSHKFGIEPILLSQSELFDLMNAIMAEKNYTKQMMLMTKLRQYFISTG